MMQENTLTTKRDPGSVQQQITMTKKENEAGDRLDLADKEEDQHTPSISLKQQHKTNNALPFDLSNMSFFDNLRSAIEYLAHQQKEQQKLINQFIVHGNHDTRLYQGDDGQSSNGGSDPNHLSD